MWVILALLCCTQEAALAGGTLSFVSLYSNTTLSRGEQYSTAVSTGGRFRFGATDIDSVYISANGYFSMGEPPLHSSLDDIPGPSSYSVVAPFAGNIDISSGGSVKYQQYTYPNYQMDGISRFIESETFRIFDGTRMIVAEWSSVPQYSKSNTITNTFQGILITDHDGSSSYAVFVYKCGGMEWGGGVIGWQQSSTQYNSHYLSGESNSNDIGCLYSTFYSTVVFKISNVYCPPSEFRCYSGECAIRCDGICRDHSEEECSCNSHQFSCDNRECIPESYRCDTIDDCGDNSDEEGCGLYLIYFGIPALVGGVFFLSLIIGIPICIGVIVCYRKRKRTYHQLQNQDHVVTATPATGASVDTSNQTASTANPVFQSQPQYAQQPQQPVDQLSSQDTSPSSTATAIPSLTIQQPSQDQRCPPQQNTPYPAENHPGHPSVDQTYTPPTVQELHGGTGDVENSGILLKE